MNKNLMALLLATSLAACADRDVPAGPARLAPYVQPTGDLTTQTLPSEYIVVLKDVSDVAREAGFAARAGAAVTAQWERTIRGFAMRASAEALRTVRENPQVAFVEPNMVVTAQGTQAPVPSWGLDRIDQQNLPLNNSYTYPNTGSGVHVYIIDTGVFLTHNEFSGRLGAGIDIVTPGGNANDCNGHGTHVAGTVGGTLYGVAKAVTLHPVRVLDCAGGGSTAGVISGINWVAANRITPAVASMSLGGSFSAALNNATTALIAANVTTSVPSGGSAADACNFSPASTPNAITVNAANKVGNSAPSTNFGPCTDLYAPGSNIVSAWNTSNTASLTLSGTSMAAAHVAGAAALYLNANPASTPAQVAAALVNNAALNKLGNVPASTPNKLLNIQFIGGPPVNQPPVASFTISCQNATVPQNCTLDASSSSDDGGLANLTFAWANNAGRPAKTGTPVKYQYSVTNPNTFDVTLTARDAQGLTSTRTATVTILGAILFQDNFSVLGTKLNLALWTTEIGIGSFLGRTQLADWVTPGGIGQFVVGATGAQVALHTYNPTGFSLYGTHGKTVATFQPTATSGVSLTQRMQLTSLQRGLVYGIYLYACIPPAPPCATHDEIDIELVTNFLQSGAPLQVQLNRYAAEPFGAGNGVIVNLPAGFDPLAAHDWTIRWSFARIEYLVDGLLLHAATTKVPQGPMNATVIAWGPDAGWPAAFHASLQPASSPPLGQSFTALL